jgi:hypothetical protein
MFGSSVSFVENVIINDVFMRAKGHLRSFTEPNIVISSAMATHKAFGRAFTEVVNVVDDFTNHARIVVSFVENVIVSDFWNAQRFITRWKKTTTPSTMLLYLLVSKWPEDGSVNPKRSEIDFGTGSRYTGMSDVSINVHAPRGPQDFITIGDSKKHKVLKCEIEIYVRDTTQPEFPELMWNIRDYLRRFLRENRTSLFEYTIDVAQQTNVRSTRMPDTDQMTDLWRTIIDVDLIYQDDF